MNRTGAKCPDCGVITDECPCWNCGHDFCGHHKGKKEFAGTCVNHPFDSDEELCEIVESGREITKATMFRNCQLDEEDREIMTQYPHDFSFSKGKGQYKHIYWYTWSMIEHFFI